MKADQGQFNSITPPLPIDTTCYCTRQYLPWMLRNAYCTACTMISLAPSGLFGSRAGLDWLDETLFRRDACNGLTGVWPTVQSGAGALVLSAAITVIVQGVVIRLQPYVTY
ncbi:hypothetical protein F5Y10DRAFT_254607 [Nemania abortiva]|nr:hypothetical protein F5Y10DRAFT_254607 [Nemania abortiva]